MSSISNNNSNLGNSCHKRQRIAPPIGQNKALRFGNYFINKDVAALFCAYLDFKALGNFDATCNGARLPVDMVCRQICKRERFIPESLPEGVNHKQFLLNLFRDRIDVSCIEKNIGKIVEEVPPVPLNFILNAQEGFQLTYHPEYQPQPSSVNQEKMAPSSATINEMFLAVSKCAKLIPVELYYKLTMQGQLITSQYLNLGFGKGHWTYQKLNPIKLDQVERIQKAGLEIVPFQDRIWQQLALYMKTGNYPTNHIREETASVVYPATRHLNYFQATFHWFVAKSNSEITAIAFVPDQYPRTNALNVPIMISSTQTLQTSWKDSWEEVKQKVREYPFGTATGVETVGLLKGKPDGTFIVRLSSEPNCITISYVKNASVANTRVAFNNKNCYSVLMDFKENGQVHTKEVEYSSLEDVLLIFGITHFLTPAGRVPMKEILNSAQSQAYPIPV